MRHTDDQTNKLIRNSNFTSDRTSQDNVISGKYSTGVISTKDVSDLWIAT